MSELHGQRVLIIGRPTGIARSVVNAAIGRGAEIVVAGRDVERLVDGYGDDAVRAETIDLTDEKSISSLATRLGTIDHVVSTASARARGRLADLESATIAISFATKAIGPILLAKHLAPIMPPSGSFVLFSGITGSRPAPGMLAVAGTNGAVDAITRALAVELAPIRVNAIAPGTIDTGAYDGLGESGKSELFARRSAANPARRIGEADDVAEAVLFALTADFVTGAIIPVDGGERLA